MLDIFYLPLQIHSPISSLPCAGMADWIDRLPCPLASDQVQEGRQDIYVTLTPSLASCSTLDNPLHKAFFQVLAAPSSHSSGLRLAVIVLSDTNSRVLQYPYCFPSTLTIPLKRVPLVNSLQLPNMRVLLIYPLEPCLNSRNNKIIHESEYSPFAFCSL